MLVICDIDGVVADISNRLPYMKRGDYANFYADANVLTDRLIEDGKTLARQFGNDSYEQRHGGRPRFIFLTGRPERTRQATTEWLRRNGLEAPLFMRANGDHRKSEVVKPELVAAILGSYKSYFCDIDDENIFFIDDDPKNIEAVESIFNTADKVNVRGLLFGSNRLTETADNDS